MAWYPVRRVEKKPLDNKISIPDRHETSSLPQIDGNQKRFCSRRTRIEEKKVILFSIIAECTCWQSAATYCNYTHF